MLKVISFTICPFVQRITALLEAKGLPYQVEYIELANKPDWFLEISPNGQVPLLLTEQGSALFESDAIAEYLEDSFGPLQPELTPEQKALNRAWSTLGSKQYLVQCSAQSSADIETLVERSAKLAGAFTKVEKALGTHRYFNSNSPSMVDIAWLPVLHRAWIIKEKTGYDFLAGFPKVQAWQSAILDSGLTAPSVSTAFMERFEEYYLSERTLLGRLRQHCPKCDCDAHTLEQQCTELKCCTQLQACDTTASQCGDSGCCG
ncbi:glutathione S-transferase family protein [Ferrimonas futtsuensis]|uniref:glutathione S-transferase family protein n=1 Tax=Ferrimonas futtsuensis TaxID=364764 RepID=UPI000428D075|nr:glutathione S-transferase family protein [Ferrimonas futtsuensis]